MEADQRVDLLWYGVSVLASLQESETQERYAHE